MAKVIRNNVLLERDGKNYSAYHVSIQSIRFDFGESKEELGFIKDNSEKHYPQLIIKLALTLIVEVGKAHEYSFAFKKGSCAKTAMEIGDSENKLRVEGNFRVDYFDDSGSTPDGKFRILDIVLNTSNS